MMYAFRLVAALLLVCLLSPRQVQAGGDLAQDPFETGERLFARKHYTTALKYYDRALRRDDMRAHYRIGLTYEELGKDKDAVRHYRRVIESGQPDPQRSDAAQRVKDIEERLKKETTRSAGLLERGKRLFTAGRYREAEQALLQAASKDASDPETHFYLGEVYTALEAYGKAASEYRKAKSSY